MKRKKKPEYAKLFLTISAVVALVVTASAIISAAFGWDGTVFAYLVPSVYTELATATGFYYWKAKNENRAKYAQEFIRELAKDYGVDNALRVAEIVLKD